MRQKKLLLLGGSASQIIAIKNAKSLGLYAVLCDFLPDNPGQYFVDKFYLVSTTDKDAVLEVARKEMVDGVVAYGSDPAAPTAAYVAEAMGLPGVPYVTAASFCDKALFRQFLRENGFHIPQNVQFTEGDNSSVIEKFNFPVIVKPTDSSGSQGVSVIYNISEFEKAKKYAANVSRNGKLLAEEFLQRDHPDVIEAEIFVINGKVAVWGLINTIRDGSTNPLLPAAYSYPLDISVERQRLVKAEVQRLIDCSNVKSGAFNIEMIITKEEKLYFLDVGPRNGGNRLPEFISQIAGCSIPDATILNAVGEYEKISQYSLDGSDGGYWGLYVIHSDSDGVFAGVDYSDFATKYLLDDSFFFNPGDYIHRFNISRDAVGLAFFKFDTKEARDEVMRDFTGKHIKVRVEV